MIDREIIKQKWIERHKIEEDCQEYFLNFLENYTTRELVRGFVLQDLREGVAPGMIQVRYDISYEQLRNMAVKMGLKTKKRYYKKAV